jgi:hypothetical protein
MDVIPPIGIGFPVAFWPVLSPQTGFAAQAGPEATIAQDRNRPANRLAVRHHMLSSHVVIFLFVTQPLCTDGYNGCATVREAPPVVNKAIECGEAVEARRTGIARLEGAKSRVPMRCPIYLTAQFHWKAA